MAHLQHLIFPLPMHDYFILSPIPVSPFTLSPQNSNPFVQQILQFISPSFLQFYPFISPHLYIIGYYCILYYTIIYICILFGKSAFIHSLMCPYHVRALGSFIPTNFPSWPKSFSHISIPYLTINITPKDTLIHFISNTFTFRLFLPLLHNEPSKILSFPFKLSLTTSIFNK